MVTKEELQAERQELINRIAKYDNKQQALKILSNAVYGSIGNPYFRYFDIRLAEAVTLSGQVIIRWIENSVNQYMNQLLGTKNKDYVAAMDTDSCYLLFEPVVKKFFPENTSKEKIVDLLDKIAKEKTEPLIAACLVDLQDYFNCPENIMVMKREVIADKGIWTAKKRYILNVHDSEGVRYKEPKLKIMGLEAIKSSTPSACRDMIKKAIEIIVTKTEEDLCDFVKECRQRFAKLPIDEICSPRGVNGLIKYGNRNTIYTRATPLHVRGSLLYNHYVKAKCLTKIHPLIQDGEKIKYIYLRMPNPINENVIAIPGSVVPPEFGLSEYIDYQLQFQKAFLEPLKIILESIGWYWEKRATIAEFLV